jgi:2-polyprenyl-3-methyl-5-hydroxy-6-metoxy-1,4-benzoquinol methylase
MLRSQMCTQASLRSAPMAAWAERLRPVWDPEGTGRPVLTHRKLWEWLFIAEALHQQGVLRPGSRGLGFGVGQEPLVALFASLGCSVVATDMAPDAAVAAGWAADGADGGHALGPR